MPIDPVADQSNLLGDEVSVPINAWGQSGQTLTYSAGGLPPGVSIDPNTGLISGTIANDASVTTPYNVTVTASDGSDQASTTFAWNVSSFTLDNPGDQSNAEGDAVVLQPSVQTNGNPTLTFIASGLPNGLSINPNTGLVAGTLANLDSNGSPYTVTISASDGTSTSNQTFTWTVTHVLLTDPGDQINAPGDVVSLPIPASDPDNDTLTYTASGLPLGLSINSATGLISGTIDAAAGSDTPYSVTVTVSDGTLHASQTFNWTVTANPVTLSNPGDQSSTEGDSVSLPLSATGGSGLTYGASGLPSGLSVNSSTGLISGTVASGDSVNGPYTVTITATDTQGNSAAQQFTWNVNAPAAVLTLTNPGNQSNAEGDNVSLPVQASDPDGDTLEYAASGLPIGVFIDPTTGLIQGTVDYSAAEMAGGQYQVTVTVNDGNGQTANQSFVWSIAATPQPPWLEPLDFQNSQSGTSASLQLVAGSPDGNALTYSASGLPSGLSVDPNTGLVSGTITAAMGSYTVTATVTDTSNNLSASQTFTWHVTCGNAPRVLMSFNGQPAGEDYVAEVGATTPVLVTLEGATPGLHTITLSIPSGESTLSLSTFQLSDGGSETVEMTAVEQSPSFDAGDLVAYVDGQEAGDPWFTNVKVTIAGAQNGGHIRNSDTPAGMADRIPPVSEPTAQKPTPWTEVSITISPTIKDQHVIVFNVQNGSGAYGTAVF